MVWKDNLMVKDIPLTLEGFLDDVFGYNKSYLWFEYFRFRLGYFKDPKDIFKLGAHLDKKHFPKHYLFGNFQCLRCGLCCKNYECVPVEREQVEKWKLEKRDDILKFFVSLDSEFFPEIYPRGQIGCPLCRKARNKPYYNCKIHDVKNSLPICRAYLCSKSLPVANLNYKDVEELIRTIGLESYYSLIEKPWGEQFDYDAWEIKTHKKLPKEHSSNSYS